MKRAVVWVLLLFFLAVPALGADSAAETVRDALPDGAKALLGEDFAVESLTGGLFSLFTKALSLLDEGLLWDTLRKIAAACLLCGGVCAFDRSLKDYRLSRLLQAVGGLCVYLICAGGSESLFSAAEDCLSEMSVFSSVYTVVYTAACAAAGAPGASAARASVAVFASGAFGQVCRGLLLPLCSVYAFLRCVCLCTDNPGLGRFASLLKSISVTGLRFSLALYSALITLSGAVGSASDGLLKRGVKTGVSAAVPIIGGALSDACDFVLAGAGVVKSTVGVMGILAFVAIALLPLLRIGLWYAGLRGAAALCTLLGQTGASEMTEIMSETMGLLFAAVASVTAAELVGIVAGFLAFS